MPLQSGSKKFSKEVEFRDYGQVCDNPYIYIKASLVRQVIIIIYIVSPLIIYIFGNTKSHSGSISKFGDVDIFVWILLLQNLCRVWVLGGVIATKSCACVFH